jgi:hypothetical protein
MQFDVSGSISGSGISSAGGAYTTTVDLKPADVQFGGVQLFIGGGALFIGGSTILQNSTPIDIDRDIPHRVSPTLGGILTYYGCFLLATMKIALRLPGCQR